MIKVGFIGVGNISPAHLNFLKTRPDVKIQALCDIKPETLADKVSKYGGTPYIYFSEMLEKEKLDAVWICTPPQVRKEPLLLCAQKGIPVFCEKPAERNLDVALEISKELKKLNAKVQIGYVFRAMYIIQELKKLFKTDKICLLNSIYTSDMSLSRSMPSWFFDKALSGGALIDQATHNLDLMRYLLGEVSSVCGYSQNPVTQKTNDYTVEETFSIGFKFKSGVLASHIHSWVSESWRDEMIILGTKRCYRLNLFAGKLVVEEGGTKYTITQDNNKMYWYQNEIFLNNVINKTWKNVPCKYEDAVKTLKLTLQCDKKVAK